MILSRQGYSTTMQCTRFPVLLNYSCKGCKPAFILNNIVGNLNLAKQKNPPKNRHCCQTNNANNFTKEQTAAIETNQWVVFSIKANPQ